MTSEMGRHMWIASPLQSQNQGSLLKDISSAPTPFFSPFQMETFFSKNTDVHVQRQLDTYCFLLHTLSPWEKASHLSRPWLYSLSPAQYSAVSINIKARKVLRRLFQTLLSETFKQIYILKSKYTKETILINSFF